MSMLNSNVEISSNLCGGVWSVDHTGKVRSKWVNSKAEVSVRMSREVTGTL